MLTTTSQYALRALVRLTRLPEQEMISGHELSSKCKIPANYLSKVMLVLRNAGMVEAVRGLNGGYRLEKPANEIPIVEVVDLFEGITSEPKCLLGEDHECSDELSCTAHPRYRRLRLAYIDFLSNTTIASISGKKSTKKKR